MAKTRKVKEVHGPVKPLLSPRVIAALSIVTAVIFYFSNPKPQSYYDYTFRVAGNLLHGTIGFVEKPPQWLNEFVPFDGLWYSVFPLGAVITMVPFAALKNTGIISDMPGPFIAALCAGAACLFLLAIANRYDLREDRRVLLTIAILFGTFTWTNLTFDGAWQLALGFAMVGELGAIYFTVYDRRPFIAGLFFALAFGNRTENLLTAPVFLFLLNRGDAETPTKQGIIERPADSGSKIQGQGPTVELGNGESKVKDQRSKFPSKIKDQDSKIALSRRFHVSAVQIHRVVWFCFVPILLGAATLCYNYIRFHSITDFGYARIPGVLQEPWYNHGIFSMYYIPRQAWEMLIKPWEWKSKIPYLVPDGFSSSILWSSPFLLFVLRFGFRDRVLKYAAWAAIAILTFLLWIHGNSGGWQFGYRYAMILMPWMFVILLESAPKRTTPLEWTVYGFSFVANAYATWLFSWTEYMK
jgi:hypothetical protein